MLTRADVPAEIDSELYIRLTAVLDEGMTVTTLGPAGQWNEIRSFSSQGAWVLTARSRGVPRLVAGWMFNVAWRELRRSGELSSQELMAVAKRSSAVLAVLALLPEVSVLRSRPLVVGLSEPMPSAGSPVDPKAAGYRQRP